MVLASEPVGGRSRATELPCHKERIHRLLLMDDFYFISASIDVIYSTLCTYNRYKQTLQLQYDNTIVYSGTWHIYRLWLQKTSQY